MCAKFKWQEEKDDGLPEWSVDGSSSTRGEKIGEETEKITWWDRHGRKALFSLFWISLGAIVIIAVSFHFTTRIKAFGTVEPFKVKYITAPVDGTVEFLSAIEGQVVERDELLARIRPDDLTAYKDVETEKFGLAGLQKEPEKTKERIEMLSDSLSRLRREAELFRHDNSEIKASQEKILAAEAEYKQAVKDEERARILLRQEAISQVEYEDVVTRMEVARANSAIARAQQEMLQNQRSIKEQQLLREIAFTEKEIELEKKTLLQKKAEYLQKKAMLQVSRDQTGRLAIFAPESGQIIRREKEISEHAKSGDLIFALAPDGRMIVNVEISPDDLFRIREGQKALIYSRGFTRGFSAAAEGRVIQVGAYARTQDQQSQVTHVPVKVLIEKSHSSLIPGSSAEVVILTTDNQ